MSERLYFEISNIHENTIDIMIDNELAANIKLREYDGEKLYVVELMKYFEDMYAEDFEKIAKKLNELNDANLGEPVA